MKNEKTVRLTNREIYLIIHALNIASEDGSIYGGSEKESEYAKINAEVDMIGAKLQGVA